MAGATWNAVLALAAVDQALSTHRGTSLIKDCPPIGPYSRNMHRALWRSLGGVQFVMSEVPLQHSAVTKHFF